MIRVRYNKYKYTHTHKTMAEIKSKKSQAPNSRFRSNYLELYNRSQRYYNKYQQKWETKWEEGPYTLDVFMNDVALQRLAHMGWPVRLKEVISTTDCATLCRINDSEATWQMDDNIFHGSIQDWSL